jgi:hypothetical protein
MPFPQVFLTLSDSLKELFKEFYWEFIVGIVLLFLGALYAFGRIRIKKWLFKRKVKPTLEKMMSVYERDILPDFVEAKPEIKVLEEKEVAPTKLPFGYIFIQMGQEHLVWDILLTCLPVSCSLRRIRVLFDEKLRKAMFDLLSYKLGEKLDKAEIAVGFRDNAMQKYPDDYEVMEKLYEDGKLTALILYEASKRFRVTGGKFSVSDVKDFSRLVRKISEIDVKIMRIYKKPATYYVKEAVKRKRGVVLLARGRYIEKAIEVSDQLYEKGFEKFTEDELGFANPDTGIWYFVHPKSPHKQVPFMRIWLKWVGE